MDGEEEGGMNAERRGLLRTDVGFEWSTQENVEEEEDCD